MHNAWERDLLLILSIWSHYATLGPQIMSQRKKNLWIENSSIPNNLFICSVLSSSVILLLNFQNFREHIIFWQHSQNSWAFPSYRSTRTYGISFYVSASSIKFKIRTFGNWIWFLMIVVSHFQPKILFKCH